MQLSHQIELFSNICDQLFSLDFNMLLTRSHFSWVGRPVYLAEYSHLKFSHPSARG
uniref:Uncharacterized protein n=1 Tax=Anguilla anguilla TaxID=7936 RepID=A0A0E9QMF7_ANGAN